jgi:hypothetical protein
VSRVSSNKVNTRFQINRNGYLYGTRLVIGKLHGSECIGDISIHLTLLAIDYNYQIDGV